MLLHIAVQDLAEALVLSSWMTYSAQDVKPDSLTALTEELVAITVDMVKMLEQFAEVVKVYRIAL